jgi:hypothetical protein
VEARRFGSQVRAACGKWTQLKRILDDDLMIDAAGNRRKLIILTEPKDTVHYLLDKARAPRRPRSGGGDSWWVSREERRKVIERFMQDKARRAARLLRLRSSAS